MTGQIQTIKLIHISGGVAWAGGIKYAGTWGDNGTKKFEIHVTYPNKTMLAPPASYGYRYSLPGQHIMNKNLTYPDFNPFLPVQTGQLFKVWYADDLRNYYESENFGTVCADVHLLYGFY